MLEDSGSGVPDGGTTGQALIKLSNEDGDAGWGTIEGGSAAASLFEHDGDGYLMPIDGTATDDHFELTEDGYIQPLDS